VFGGDAGALCTLFRKAGGSGKPGRLGVGLNIKRVNNPSKKLANNAVVGAIDLDLDMSYGLKEKTNREGFFDNIEFYRFRRIIESALEHFNMVRGDDRKALDEILKKDPVKEGSPVRFRKATDKIEEIAKRKGFHEEIYCLP